MKEANRLVWVVRKEIRWGGVYRFHYDDPSVSTKSRHSLN